jgi:hypothetical protein
LTRPVYNIFTWFDVLTDSWACALTADGVVIYLQTSQEDRRQARDRPKATHYTSGFVGPGESITLVTADGDGLFVRKAERLRMDDQTGIECSVFRLEPGATGLASELIREAVAIAWNRWTGERLFTFVKPAAIRSTNPGYCFIKAGWSRCGWSKGGLRILEVLP